MNRPLLIVKWAVGALVAVALLLFPLNASPYATLQLSLAAAYAVALVGLSIVTGHAGQISLAQAAFFGLGAYSTAIFANMGVPVVVAFAAACLIPGLLGLIVAFPVVKLHGHSLALITLALSLIAVPIAIRFKSLTGATRGLRADIGEAPAWSGLARDQWGFYVSVVVAAVLFLVARNMVKGKMGRALALVRTNEVVGASMGVPIRRYKILAFAISASFGGAGGFLFVYNTQYVSPDTLGFLLGITLLASLVIGGMRSLVGPVIGALFYVYVPTIAGSVSPEQSALIYGIVLVLVVLFVPGGIAGGLALLPRLIARRRRTGEATAAERVRAPLPPMDSPEPIHTHHGGEQ
ncbi:MAG: branched-chain amino acid ABC transporter permease [Microbacterium sp.]